MKARMPFKAARKVALAAATVGVLAVATGVGTAGAATSSDILYSIDGGASWSSSVTVSPGQVISVRQWYDNNGNDNETNASLTTSVPDGFTLRPGSTRICLNPSTTNPSSPNETTDLQCAPSDESAVWSGQDLQISPIAGHYGISDDQVSGILPMGHKRYFNLHSCTYVNAATGDYLFQAGNTNDQPIHSGTKASNIPDLYDTQVCSNPAGSGNPWAQNYAVQPGSSSDLVLDMFDNRYVNLHSCMYADLAAGDYMSQSGGYTTMPISAGTNASNVADSTVSCTNPAGSGNPWAQQYVVQPGRSSVIPLDILNSRYINLHSCLYANLTTGDYFYQSGGSPSQPISAGTNASMTPDTQVVCSNPAGSGNAWAQGYVVQPGRSSVRVIDTLDTTRGRGYVQYRLNAPPEPDCLQVPPVVHQQSAALTSDPSGTKTATGQITVDWPLDLCPTPMVDPQVGAITAGLVSVGAAGYFLYRRREAAAA